MPTYRNISKGYYTNTKYNVFNIAPGETFECDKYIDSPHLEVVDDLPPAHYEGDSILTINPGDTIEFDVSKFHEVAIIPDVNNADSDFVYLSINTPPNLLTDDEKETISKDVYFHEEGIDRKGYLRLYFEAPGSNSAPYVVKVVYKYR